MLFSFARNITGMARFSLPQKSLIAIGLSSLLGLVWNLPYLVWYIFLVFGLLLRLLDGEESIGRQTLFLIFPFTLCWNVSTLWWVWNASPSGAISMALANTIILACPWILYSVTQRQCCSSLLAYLVWIATQLSVEYLHYNWEGNFPWLNVGNIFSYIPSTVQWISYTGIAGISLWILLVNAVLHFIISRDKWSNRWFGCMVMLIAFPMLGSMAWQSIHNEFNQKAEQPVLILQPNIDTYTQKFDENTIYQQVDKFLRLSATAQQRISDTGSTLWVWPETCIPPLMNAHYIDYEPILKPVHNYLIQHPNIQILMGVSLYDDRAKKNTRLYNAAILLNSKGVQGLHIKSKLVPGAEQIPFQKQLQFLDKFIINLGGASGSLSEDTTLHLFMLSPKHKFSTTICYESVFGEYTANFIKNGSMFIALITNDDWWGNTPGHVQHFNYARLRAIENRRYIVRSANTGISAIIDAYGNVISPQLSYKQEGTIVGKIPMITYETFYTQHGDYIYRGAFILLLLSVGYMFFALIIRKVR